MGESIFTYESGETFSTFDKCGEAYKGGIETEIEASKLNAYHPCYTAAQGNVDDIETCFTECVAAEMLGGNVKTCIKQWEASRKNSIKSSEGSGSYTPDTRRDVIYEPGSSKTRMPTNTPTALPTTSPPTKKAHSSTNNIPNNEEAHSSTNNISTNKKAHSSTNNIPTNKKAHSSTNNIPTNKKAYSSTNNIPTNKKTHSSTNNIPTNKKAYSSTNNIATN